MTTNLVALPQQTTVNHRIIYYAVIFNSKRINQRISLISKYEFDF